MDWASCPKLQSADVHGRFEGIRWRYDSVGVFVEHQGIPERTNGEPVTCRTICGMFAEAIISCSGEFAVPPEIIVMTIATEAAAYRSAGFTGPPTFRWESNVLVKDSPPEYKGDYSVGPMQTLATTAREVIGTRGLGYDPFVCFPAYRDQPPAPPLELLGYRTNLNIRVGVAEIASRWKLTRDDPILVAAAYNSGGLRKAPNKNRWHLSSHGNHLDRAARWFGDACAVITALRG
jgi:peptidoglycan L-alanyl-D-glutamate endopeptidase CwlK